MKDEFSRCHPGVNFLFYVLVLGITLFYMHPVLLVLSGLAACGYLLCLRGGRGLARVCLLALPVVILSAVVNPLFSHQGLTVLGYLPTGNPVTLESILYGLSTGGMMGVVILWCATWQDVMTSDKVVYLFGKGFPALSLIFSMALRFLPMFLAQAKQVSAAQRCVGRDVGEGTPWQRLKKGVRVLSILVTWTLEHSVDTADSMRARGYGLRGRTMYHPFRWDGRSNVLAAGMALCFAGVAAGAFTGQLHMLYVPMWRMNAATVGACLCYVLYGGLCALPLILNLVEDLKWRYWMCKI
ncbi:energy-coupling factor transporter transmembrane protein EcfT [Pseudoflavonifractor capillosus]|uniref:energy-coupling factor transporter transmembrane component T n=1 Tax=Pseudoflavonifractor capillosus TaxID=106588 RepID=UPI001957AC3C|nr:energy-coupling factor transporter transmembrane component T [Pseudoflavonifractor capillosus]MBM6896283.1 energy-coupling factor transporter transmembrane protein EcfT [Pseudoflavonifractor capillosus]